MWASVHLHTHSVTPSGLKHFSVYHRHCDRLRPSTPGDTGQGPLRILSPILSQSRHGAGPNSFHRSAWISQETGCLSPLLGGAPPGPSGSLATLSTWLEVDSYVLSILTTHLSVFLINPPLLPTPQGDGLSVTGLLFLGCCIACSVWMVSCPP